MSTSSRKLRPFHLALRKELAAQFRVDPDHPGIERILEVTEAHLEDTIAELVESGAMDEAAPTTALSRFGTASRVARACGALKEPSLALTVAAAGVAGVLAFGVSQRTHEFGVRAALGANRSLLMRVVLKEGALLALFGLTLGLAASLFFAELLSGMLHDIAPADVATLGLVALTLILVALLASAVPAWRASEIDPCKLFGRNKP